MVSVSGQVAVVNAGGSLWDLGFIGAPPAAGATVRILWDGDGGTALGVVGNATPAPDKPVDQPGAGGDPVTINARPIGWATYRGGSRDTSEQTVAQGYYPGYAHFGTKSGIWVYGDVWGGAKGKTCSRLQIQIARHAGMGDGAGTEGYLLLLWGDVQEPSLRALAAERNRLVRECQVFCVWLIGSMLPERSKDDDDFQRTAGRVAEGLQAA